MINEAWIFLLDVLLQPFAAILLLRFHLQWLRVPLQNPVGEFVMVMSNFIVLRVRRYVPAIRGLDSASLLLAWLAELFYLTGMMAAQGYPVGSISIGGLIILAAVKLLKISIYLLMAAVFAQAILSWINPHNPIGSVLAGITYRLLQPLRRIVPLFGAIDLSALLLFIICQLIIIVPIGLLERLALGMA
jgi:YggT family protein